jgi:hypothetical protein
LKYAATSIVDEYTNDFDNSLQDYEQANFDDQTLRDKILPLIDELDKKQKKTKHRQSYKRVGQVAVIVLLAVTIFTTILYNTSEAVKIRVLNIIYNIQDEFTDIEVKVEDKVSNDVNSIDNNSPFLLTLTYLPQGMKIQHESNRAISYVDEEGNTFDLTTVKAGGIASIDTENAILKEYDINDKNVKLYIKEENTIAVWEDNQAVYIANSNMDEEIILQIITGLKLVTDKK